MGNYMKYMFYNISIRSSYNFLCRCLLLSVCYLCKYRITCLSRGIFRKLQQRWGAGC